MSLDPITEKIAHFIGSFDMLIEQARMREAYEEFRALLAEEAQANSIELFSHRAKHTYKLEDFDPKMQVALASYDGGSKLEGDGIAPEVLGPGPAKAPSLLGPEGSVLPNVVPAYGSPFFDANFVLPNPASVITVTNQFVTLYDNDTFGVIQSAFFQPIQPILSALEEMVDFAQSLSLISLDGISHDTDWFAYAADISDLAAQITPIDNGNTVIALFQGDENVVLVDGKVVDELPEWDEIIPLYHAIEKAEQEDEASDADTAEHDFSKDFEKEGSADIYNNSGTEVVAGANTLINTASVYSTWLDAQVFAVAGSVLNLDVISQVNLLIDHDMGFEPYLDDTADSLPSKTINAASIRELSEAEAELEAIAEREAEEEGENPQSGDEDEDDQSANTQQPSNSKGNSKNTSEAVKSGSHPSNWAVVRHEGDVVQINAVQQYTFTTDMDQAVLSFGAATTFLGLGENLIVNDFNTAQYGFGFDLIVVGGDMIELNLINQLNVMLDSDVLIPKTPALPGEAVGTVSAGSSYSDLSCGTEVIGDTSDAEDISMVHLPAPEEEATGPLASTAQTSSNRPADTEVKHAPEQTPQPQEPAEALLASLDSADDAQDPRTTESETSEPSSVMSLAAPLDVEEEHDEDLAASDPTETEPESSDALANPPSLSTQDNLLYNKASIEKTGEDTLIEITENFVDAVQDFVNGGDEVSDDVVQDDLFLGTELLKVLYIDGDFTTANIVNQTNILGDSDQLQIAQDHFAAALQNEIEITTGSNIEANFASIKKNGVDSVVMASGDTYSDALIHQANLVDTNLAANGAMGTADLASEAVAFLAEGLIGPDLADQIAANANQIVADAMAQAVGTEAILT